VAVGLAGGGRRIGVTTTGAPACILIWPRDDTIAGADPGEDGHLGPPNAGPVLTGVAERP